MKKDEIGEVKDNPEKETPESKPETTPEVITLSPQELDKKINDGKAELGRSLKKSLEVQAALQKSFDEHTKRYSDLESNFKTYKLKDRETELEKFKDDKGMLDALKLKHKLEDERNQILQERSEFEKNKAMWEGRLSELAKAQAESLAKELAQTSSLSPDLLLQISSDTSEGKTIYNLERMKQIAQSVPKERAEEEEVKGQRSMTTSVGGRSATRGLNTLTDYYEAYNKGEINHEEMMKARARFK